MTGKEIRMPDAFHQRALLPERQQLLVEEQYRTSKEYIAEHLKQTREAFLLTYEKNRGKLAYIPDYDYAQYTALYEIQKTVNPSAFQEALAGLDAEVRFNVKTLLGEMFHAGLSEFEYFFRDGKLYSPFSEEPFLDVVVRGQQTREINGSTEVPRERAEVIGFTAIENRLRDAPPGTMMVSVSPPGGQYNHNFYDVFDVGEKGKVSVRRYSSVLGNDEYLQKLVPYDTRYKPEEVPEPAFFLSHPVLFLPDRTPFRTPDDLHAYFHKDHGAMSLEEFTQQVMPAHEGFINRYIERLNDRQLTDNERQEALKALLVFAQNYDEWRKENQGKAGVIFDQTVVHKPTDKEIAFLARQDLKKTSLPCGMIEAYGSSFGVIDAGVGRCKDCGSPSSDNHYHCPKELRDRTGRKGCGRSFPDETNEDEKTPACGSCGFKFNC